MLQVRGRGIKCAWTGPGVQRPVHNAFFVDHQVTKARSCTQRGVQASLGHGIYTRRPSTTSQEQSLLPPLSHHSCSVPLGGTLWVPLVYIIYFAARNSAVNGSVFAFGGGVWAGLQLQGPPGNDVMLPYWE